MTAGFRAEGDLLSDGLHCLTKLRLAWQSSGWTAKTAQTPRVRRPQECRLTESQAEKRPYTRSARLAIDGRDHLQVVQDSILTGTGRGSDIPTSVNSLYRSDTPSPNDPVDQGLTKRYMPHKSCLSPHLIYRMHPVLAADVSAMCSCAKDQDLIVK
jgi:hypothetical protein